MNFLCALVGRDVNFTTLPFWSFYFFLPFCLFLLRIFTGSKQAERKGEAPETSKEGQRKSEDLDISKTKSGDWKETARTGFQDEIFLVKLGC